MPFTPRRVGGVAYSLVMFIVVSVLSGVLIAGLFVPLAGLAGVSSKAAAEELDNLPAELATPVPPTRSKVLMGNGKILAYFYDENRIYVKLDKIAPVMRQAQLAIEDHRFYEHGALDLRGTLRALVRNSSGAETQGGSSISQQYVKMVQIEACQGDKQCIDDATRSSGAEGYQRKIRELRYAIALEKRFTKDQILERYLNIAYYGEGAYGVEAAARHYYNKNAKDLDLGEAAMLAGLVQNPDANNPVDNPGAADDRRDVVLNRMAELKIITAKQSAAAKQEKFDKKEVKPTRNGCVGTKYPFLCDYVYRTPADHAESRQDGRGAREQRQARRPDHPDGDRPEDPGHRPEGGQPGRRSQGPADLHHEHDPAGHRSDPGHGAEPTGDGQRPRRARPTGTWPSTRRWAASRATRPARPSRRSPRPPPWRRASRCRRSTTPGRA